MVRGVEFNAYNLRLRVNPAVSDCLAAFRLPGYFPIAWPLSGGRRELRRRELAIN